jgi:hypothetical protein
MTQTKTDLNESGVGNERMHSTIAKLGDVNKTTLKDFRIPDTAVEKAIESILKSELGKYVKARNSLNILVGCAGI